MNPLPWCFSISLSSTASLPTRLKKHFFVVGSTTLVCWFSTRARNSTHAAPARISRRTAIFFEYPRVAYRSSRRTTMTSSTISRVIDAFRDRRIESELLFALFYRASRDTRRHEICRPFPPFLIDAPSQERQWSAAVCER